MGFHHYAQTLLASGIFIFVSAAHAEEERRELGPHVHGHGTLAVAIEGNTIQMELVAPGMDIVGFEHEADTARQERAVEAALADLKEPLSLFELPDTAGCSVTSADVKIVAHEHEHHDAPAKADKGAATEEHDDHHTEFRANYAFACADASQVRSINFRFFDRFRDSWELDVTFIDADGETAFAVSREFRNMER